MKKLMFTSLMSILCSLPFFTFLSSCQKEKIDPEKTKTLYSEKSKFLPNFVLAKTSNELEYLQKNPIANLIRTQKQFDDLLTEGKTPLSKLPITVQQKFRNQLVFRDGLGVVGLNFECIKSRLTYDEFAQVLGFFGLDVKRGYWGFSQDVDIKRQLGQNENSILLEEDHVGYHCNGKHTCIRYSPDICLSGC